MTRKKKLASVIKKTLYYTFIGITAATGIFLYIMFLGYTPGANVNDLFMTRIGIGVLPLTGILSGIFITFPVLIIAFEIYTRVSFSYINYMTENGSIHLSDGAIAAFVTDVVTQISGVESQEVSVTIYKENRIGIHIWLDTDEKSDFVRFSERVQQRVLQDLEFNFGIKKIKYFHVYIESTNINASGTGYKVNYN